MPNPKSIFKIILIIAGVAILIFGVLFINFTYPYVGSEALERALGDYSWAIKASVYGIGSFLLILGVLEILSGVFQNKCLICLVSVFIILV